MLGGAPWRKTPICRRCSAVFSRRADQRRMRHCSVRCRFLEKVEPHRGQPDACWPWPFAKHGKGYGHFRVSRGLIAKAHRCSYEFFVGPIPEGLQALHKCDQPSCWNPGHLFLGDNDDNLKDRQTKGRQARGETHARAKLTECQVIQLRAAPETAPRIRAEANVTDSTIRHVLMGWSWRHLNDAPRRQRKKAA